MPKSKNYDEIDDIREDIKSLKGNVIELTKHVQQDGKEQVDDMRALAEKRLEEVANTGKENYKALRSRVKEKPEQSLALAFAGGLLASYLMARR